MTAGQITNFEALGRRFASGGFEPRLSSALPGFVDRTEDTFGRALRARKRVELRKSPMKKLKLTREHQERFLTALAETGIVSVAAKIAGTSRTRVYELRNRDEAFAAAWEDAEERAADALEAEAFRRAVVGVPVPLVSVGKIVRDDEGQPLVIRQFSDSLLITLLKARRPERFKDRAAIEHDISDRVADRLEAARLRAIARLTAPMIDAKAEATMVETVVGPAEGTMNPQKR